MNYDVELTSRAERDLERLPHQAAERVDEAMLRLKENPRPRGARKVQNRENAYRIRVGRYRIIYDVIDDQGLVVVLRVSLRREDTYRF